MLFHAPEDFGIHLKTLWLFVENLQKMIFFIGHLACEREQ